MKIKTQDILIGTEIKITYNGITEYGKIVSLTENGFWFNGKEIDQYIKISDIDPDNEYFTGNTIHFE